MKNIMMMLLSRKKKQPFDSVFCEWRDVLRTKIEHHQKVECTKKPSSSSSHQLEGNVVSASQQAIASTPAKKSNKYRLKFHNKEKEVILTVIANGISAGDNSVFVDYGDQILSVIIDAPGEDLYIYQPRLFGEILPAECRHVVNPRKVQIHLVKAELMQWARLEYVESRLLLFAEKTNVSKGLSKPTPAKGVKNEEKCDKLDRYAAMKMTFRDKYKAADHATRSAMRKSFVESNGWNSLLEGTEPDGMENKRGIAMWFVMLIGALCLSGGVWMISS